VKHRGRAVLYVTGVVLVVIAVVFVWVLHHRRVTADEEAHAQLQKRQQAGPQVVVTRAQAAPPQRTIVLPGDVRPWRVATVYARVSGYLADLRVDRGDKVERDQILGGVTTPETQRQLAPLLDNLATRRVIADRLRPLVPKGVVSQQDLDRADADVQAAKSEVDRLRALMTETTIRAPFAGIVTRRYVDIGALMPAPTGSTQSAQPLVDVADLSRVRIVVYVGQRDALGINVGDPVEIKRDDDPTHPIQAHVTRIPQELDLRTRTMWVETELDNRKGTFYAGVFVTVTLKVPAPRGVEIPSEAIALTAGKPAVAIVRDGRVHFTPIEVADDDGKTARVTKGVAAGDLIAARLSDELTDNGPVRVVEPGLPQARRPP